MTTITNEIIYEDEDNRIDIYGLDYTSDAGDEDYYEIKPHHFGIKKCGYMNREQFKKTFCDIEYFLYRCSCGDGKCDDNIKMRQLIDDPTYQSNVVVIITNKADRSVQCNDPSDGYICVDIKLDGVLIGTDEYCSNEFDPINDIYLLEQLEMERINQIKKNLNEFILKKINKHTAQEILDKTTILNNNCIDKVLLFI